jgi:hypothetical protein
MKFPQTTPPVFHVHTPRTAPAAVAAPTPAPAAPLARGTVVQVHLPGRPAHGLGAKVLGPAPNRRDHVRVQYPNGTVHHHRAPTLKPV